MPKAIYFFLPSTHLEKGSYRRGGCVLKEKISLHVSTSTPFTSVNTVTRVDKTIFWNPANRIGPRHKGVMAWPHAIVFSEENLTTCEEYYTPTNPLKGYSLAYRVML